MRNHESQTTIMYNESIGIRDSNEAEIFSIKRVLDIWKLHRRGQLVIERDLTNAIKWAKGQWRHPWRLITTVKEIRAWVTELDVSFVHSIRLANNVENYFIKLRVDNDFSGVFFL